MNPTLCGDVDAEARLNEPVDYRPVGWALDKQTPIGVTAHRTSMSASRVFSMTSASMRTAVGRFASSR